MLEAGEDLFVWVFLIMVVRNKAAVWNKASGSDEEKILGESKPWVEWAW